MFKPRSDGVFFDYSPRVFVVSCFFISKKGTILDSLFNWVVGNPEKAIPVLGAAFGLILGGVWTVLTFFQKILVEKEERQFQRYRKLIEELNKGIRGEVYVDYQLNAVYELRFFKKYYSRSVRIVRDLIPRWEESDSYVPANIEELRATVAYLEIRQTVIGRICIFIVNVFWPWRK
ncbi:hypothetical protein [Citrobacter amalonaticus]|uniref:hypothetical protein n=1 Tax=Citrobacter amalonaticus TaxID=35703 RepID=UPI00207D1FF1|nr:hypothetical protein [Citrobacter amalonaticus]MCO4156881.1 hypothetical protein [Citrobacter amalonaticus]